MKATLKMLGGALLGWTLAVGMIGCGGVTKKPLPEKNSGEKGPEAATKSNQKASTKVTSKTSKGKSKGSSIDGIRCDRSIEGMGYCQNDNDMIFCARGTWWLLSCSDLIANSYCGVGDIGVDCWVDGDWGDEDWGDEDWGGEEDQ